MTMNRRTLNKILLGAVAGIAAGAKMDGIGSAMAGPAEGDTKDAGDKHVCKGMINCKGQGGCDGGAAGCAGKNDCKGQGGCATSAKHDCKGMNDCKGQGGCKSGDNGCAGKNSCKGHGGCKVPVEHL
jgi:hypothetical protein